MDPRRRRVDPKGRPRRAVPARRRLLGSLLGLAGLAMLAFGACLGWFALRRRKRERGQGLRSVNRP